MTRRDALRLKAMSTIREVHAFADRVLGQANARTERLAPVRDARAEEKRREMNEALRNRRKVYRAVDARSGGMCEFTTETTWCQQRAVEHDHFWGRGKDEETVETVWHLCKLHHDAKTAWKPSRAQWIEWFRIHCWRRGLSAATMEKCSRALALEAGQHPEER